MGVVQDIFASRKRAGLALDFGAETITLLVEDVQAPQGWSPLSTVMLADETFSEDIEAMRSLAAVHSDGCVVDLWLPEDQILNTHLELKSSQFWNRAHNAKVSLGSRTGLTPDQINVDLAQAPGDVWAICAVEAKVVTEAQDYARRWGFSPNMATTRYADAAFVAPPDLSGEPNRKPLVIGAGAVAAAAACVAVAVLAWPSAQTSQISSGPDRIAMAPAAALPSPTVTESTTVTVPAEIGEAIAFNRPSAPEPGLQKPLILSNKEHDFAASILSPSQQNPGFLSIDFSLPEAETATPIFANVAYRAPSLEHTPPSFETAEEFAPGAEPATGPSALPSLSLGDGFGDGTSTPSELGTFDVAALGPAPRALRTEDLIVESEEVQAPEQTENAEDPVENAPENPAVDDASEEAPITPDAPPAVEAATEDQPTPEARPQDPPAVEIATEDQPSPEAAPQDPAASEVATTEDTPPPDPKPIVRNAVDPRELALRPEPKEPEPKEVEEAPGPGSVAAAPRPGKRPDSLDFSPGPGAVAAAPAARTRPKSIKPKATAVARNTSSAKTVRAPSRGKPTGRGLANAATLKGAITLDKTSLLGVFGTKENRRALLRMSDGRMKRVSQGEVIDGWVVSRIQATSMRMTRGGEVRNLNLIR